MGSIASTGRLQGALGIGAAMLLVGGRIIRRLRRARPEGDIPLIVDLASLSPVRPVEARDRPVAPDPREFPSSLTRPGGSRLEGAHPAPPLPVRPESAAPVDLPRPRPVEVAESPREAESARRVVSTVYLPENGEEVPQPGTGDALQLLPGSLEILAGAEGSSEIRFFRSAALEIPEITLGRSPGEPYRHIHLWAPSVSRLHARMRFEGGRWKITNLSRTNPMRVNDLVFDGAEAGCTLGDGDHIQLGEVVLRYRENRP